MSTSPTIEGGASSPSVGSPRITTPSLGDHIGSGSAGAAGSFSTSPPSSTIVSAVNTTSSTASPPTSSSAAMNSSGITIGGASILSGSTGLLGTSSTATSATSIAAASQSTSAASNPSTTSSALGLTSSGVSDVRLKRSLEHNKRLREQLDMHRISVSEASKGLIDYAQSTKDALLPNIWGTPASDPFSKKSSGCCTIC